MSNPSSLPVAQRIPTLDIVRGFALLGILIMNMPGFSSSFFAEADGSHLWPGRLDQFAEEVRDLLFSGKFNSMFSLLFGIGFTIQFERMKKLDPQHATGLYLRRLLVLGAFGLVHAMVFWTGDVLHVYALLGLVLLFGLQRVSDRTLVILIGGCLLYPAVSGALRLLVVTPDVTAMLVARAKTFEISNNAAYGHGSFAAAAIEHTREFTSFYANGWALWGYFGFYVQMAMTMLIGVLAGRRQWPRRIPELLPRIPPIQWGALAIGITCGAAFTVIFALHRVPGPSPIKLLGGICYWTSRLALMIFYVLSIVRIAQTSAGLRALAPLAACGRMPLTNYLMQTLLCTTLFYGWGVGLWGSVGPAAGIGLALAIYFGIQVPWSVWWLRSHERGPMEALWAWLTYARAKRDRAPARPA